MDSMSRVVDGLVAELRHRRGEIQQPFTTAYIGGGTPSVLNPAMLTKLVNAIDSSQLEEFTIEVNPDDVTADAVALWLSLGINRVSIGVQSLRDSILSFIGRRHDAARALDAIDTIRSGGIKNISADLIYGLPGLSQQWWEQDLEKLLSSHITHLSAYCLTWNEGTRLYNLWRRGRVAPASDDTIEAQFNALRHITAKHGFDHYEISNFARPGFRSRHNSAYWNPCSRWLGIGPSAHSFDGDTRRIDDSHISSWLSRLPYPCDIDPEDDIDRINDNIVTALRTADGLDLTTIPATYRATILASAATDLKNGTLIHTSDRLAIPPSHWLTSDSYIRNLIILH